MFSPQSKKWCTISISWELKLCTRVAYPSESIVEHRSRFFLSFFFSELKVVYDGRFPACQCLGVSGSIFYYRTISVADVKDSYPHCDLGVPRGNQIFVRSSLIPISPSRALGPLKTEKYVTRHNHYHPLPRPRDIPSNRFIFFSLFQALVVDFYRYFPSGFFFT